MSDQQRADAKLREQLPHLRRLKQVLDDDLNSIGAKERTYKGSWKKRGGPGAFMMLARKWDRIENKMEEYDCQLFDALEDDFNFGEYIADGFMDDIRDLRRYLALVEAHMNDVNNGPLPMSNEDAYVLGIECLEDRLGVTGEAAIADVLNNGPYEEGEDEDDTPPASVLHPD